MTVASFQCLHALQERRQSQTFIITAESLACYFKRAAWQRLRQHGHMYGYCVFSH